eukprot:TRINITY_DN3900_c0_g2_i3.p1 TRINITY_DN3900_c0_g2~~TRINITY_DN3900_c0_g2_i3.p1  ORF type:complete len:129 (-),score=3.56 TRINITY_DN3900_c0_g2_i3:19-405(-)
MLRNLFLFFRADTIPKIKKEIAIMNEKYTNNDVYFKEIYQYAFNFAKGSETKVDISSSSSLLSSLLSQKYPHSATFVLFLQNNTDNPLNFTQWMHILEFFRTIKPDFSNYYSQHDPLIDEFVKWARSS